MNELKDLKSERWSREEPTEGFPSDCGISNVQCTEYVCCISLPTDGELPDGDL